MDKTDRLRDYGLTFLLYEQGLGICGYELIRELFIFIKLILNSYLVNVIYMNSTEEKSMLKDAIVTECANAMSELQRTWQLWESKDNEVPEFFKIA